MRPPPILLATKVEQLVKQAMSHISGDNPSRQDLWRAYVAVEYAVLDLKLRHKIEHAPPPPKRGRKDAGDLALAKRLLGGIDLAAEEKKLLYDLRACRDVLKSLVVAYERRSTTS
jgi:hypothetical protein